MPERIPVENVNHPGKTNMVDAAKYRAMRGAVLAVLPAAAPGMTLADVKRAVLPRLPQAEFPGGATAGWWIKAVQLDLEAKRVIAREACSPLRLHHA